MHRLLYVSMRKSIHGGSCFQETQASCSVGHFFHVLLHVSPMICFMAHKTKFYDWILLVH